MSMFPAAHRINSRGKVINPPDDNRVQVSQAICRLLTHSPLVFMMNTSTSFLSSSARAIPSAEGLNTPLARR